MRLDGRWRGWYAYSTGGHHHPMELSLSQHEASVAGAGMDDIGPFTMKGRCAEDGAVSWLKSYLTHSVDYDGRCDGRFIRGGWRLPGGQGTFCLWRDGAEPAAAEAKTKAKPQRRTVRR